MIGAASRVASGLVAVSIARPLLVVISCIAIAVGAALFSASAFDVRTDLDALIASDLPWRHDAHALETAFPSQGDDITIIVDGATPERAEEAAASLTSHLVGRTDLYDSVQRANGGPFFDRQALLFLPVDEVRRVTSDLIAMQPLLGPIAADPSLRGLAAALESGLADQQTASARLHEFAHPLAEVDRVLAEVEAGRAAFLSWRNLAGDETATADDWRQFIEIIPKLDYSQLAPGQAAVGAIRDAAASLQLTRDSGVRVRVSGSVPIANDELATLGETTGPVALLMLASVVLILLAGVRSGPAIIAILATVAVGAAVTAAIGLLVFHRFNLVSIAFFPLFVGLSIDFAIQFTVRARAERAEHTRDLRHALMASAQTMGPSLIVACAAIAAAFFAFLPTQYRGVAELGLIAGAGMITALLLTLSFLPALLLLFRAPAAGAVTHAIALAGGDQLVVRLRLPILAIAAVAGATSFALLPHLTFNFDPMRLRSPKTESVAAYLELVRSLDTTPTTLNILSPNLQTAQASAARLGLLPETGEALTLANVTPEHQAEKLAIISDARLILDPTLNPFFTAPRPNDAENVEALRRAAARLRALAPLAASNADRARTASLGIHLEHLAVGGPELRQRANHALLGGLPTALTQISAALDAEPTTIATVPPEIRRDWVAPDGRARIQVSPARPLQTLNDTTRFVDAVRRIEPTASGDAATIVEVGRTIIAAFLQAGVLSSVAIAVMLFIVLRSLLWTVLAIVPIILSGLLSFATCVMFGLDINLENMIALPLLLAVGIALNVYFVMARRSGQVDLLGSSLARGVLLSALTTGTAFAALGLSAHPGTASMGLLLLIALSWTLLCTLVVLPALLSFAPVQTKQQPAEAA